MMTDKQDDLTDDSEDDQGQMKVAQDCSTNPGELPTAKPAVHAEQLSAPGLSDAQQVREQTQPGGMVAGRAAEFATTGVRSGIQPLPFRCFEAFPRGREGWQPPVTATAAYGSANYDTPPYTSVCNAMYDSDCPVLTRMDSEHRYPLRSLRTLAQPEAFAEASESEERAINRPKSLGTVRTELTPLDDIDRQEIAEWACDVAKRGSIIEREVPAVLRRDCPSVYGDHMANESEQRTDSRISYELPTPNKRLSLECRARMEQTSGRRRQPLDSGHYGTDCEDNTGFDRVPTSTANRYPRPSPTNYRSHNEYEETNRKTGNRMSCTRTNPENDSDTHTSEENDSDRRSRRSVVFQDDLNRTRTRPRRSDFIKLDRFDGTTSLEAFLAHFDNCARYNGWGYADKLSQLKASLKGAAAEVLFENERSISLQQLRNELKDNFGNEGFQNEFETQLKTRRRQKGETVRVLYQDVNRLVIQAYPGQSGSIRDKLAIDAFIVSLNDPELELSVRNACTKTLKECFRTALLHESNRALVRGAETSRDRRRDVRTDVQARVVTVGEPNNWTRSNNDSDAVISNSQENMLKRMQDLEQMLKQMQGQNQQNKGHNARGNRYQGNAVTVHPTYPNQNSVGNSWQPPVANIGSNTQWGVRNQNQFPETMRNTSTQFANVPPNNNRNFACFTCGSPEHISRNCPSRPRFPRGACFQCGQVGHLRVACPQVSNQSRNLGTGHPSNQMSGYPTNQMGSYPPNQMSSYPPNQMRGLPTNQMV